MAVNADVRPLRIAGRVDELRRLESAIDRAVNAQPSAVFVHGEAGVGKTRLVREACDRATLRGFEVVWGRCLRFGAVESVLLPWVSALEGWLAAASPVERGRVVAAVPDASDVLPSLGGRAADAPLRLLRVVDAVVKQIVLGAPTVLVLDDVQWADPASRDALTYVMAGFGRERLLVLATYRDESLAPGDPLHGWLADVRRLPSVGEQRLDRLSSEETETQLGLLLGGSPSPVLVADVVQRSGGNAYLTELLAHGLEVGAESLPSGYPADLADALLAAWHRLPALARELVRAVAVGGRPTRVDRLRAVCERAGVPVGEVVATLGEAIHGGLLVRTDPGTVWFRHPLLAELLVATFLPGEAASLHRAWAHEVGSWSAVGVEEVRRLGDLALHHEGAGDLDACFAASIEAADTAREARLWRDEATHLGRAIELWSCVDTAPARRRTEAEMLERAAVVLARIGRSAEAVAAAERGLALAAAEGDALRQTRLLLLRWEERVWLRGRSEDAVAEGRRLVELTNDLPDSSEHAEALARLSVNSFWYGDGEQASHWADAALAAAQRAGSVEALCVAHVSRALAHTGDQEEEFEAREAVRYAGLTGDAARIAGVVQHHINFLVGRGRLREALDVEEEALRWAVQDGALAAVAFRSGSFAYALADQGRLRAAAESVRTGLSLVGVTSGAAHVRLAALVVTVRRGQLSAAALHLRRANEQVNALEERPALEAPPTLAEYLLARGEAEEALGMLRRTMLIQAVDPRVADRMLMWGARAAADLAGRGRDQRDEPAVQAGVSAMEGLMELRAGLVATPFAPADHGDPVQPAYAALHAAESRRCHDGGDPDLWASAAALCERAALHWEENVARWRQAELLVARGSNRAAAVALREVHQFTSREGAARLHADVEALAMTARISLDEPRQPPRAPTPSGPLSGLTAREQEVLSHLVAGRTYAEIAAALFISEKTVSTHVSHLLRKTGTSSRQEVSALALRLGVADV
jgi:DNA-binding CsgD family transcriptional regulator/tetratricopeptide (TPR) repeat protein